MPEMEAHFRVVSCSVWPEAKDSGMWVAVVGDAGKRKRGGHLKSLGASGGQESHSKE